MPKNFADALGETAQQAGRDLVPFMQLMREQRAEAAAGQFERDLKLSKYQLDVDKVEIDRQGLDQRRHESRMSMIRYMNPRATSALPTTFKGMGARYLGQGGAANDPYMDTLVGLEGRFADAGRADKAVDPTKTGEYMALESAGRINTASRDRRNKEIAWNKELASATPQVSKRMGPFPDDPVDTLAQLEEDYKKAKLFGEAYGFSEETQANPRLNPYMRRIENAVKQTPLVRSQGASRRDGRFSSDWQRPDDPLAQFANSTMSAVAELNQPDQNGLQQAFQQQLPPDFNEWPPEDQQAAWEMFLETQGQ
ncbi:MAG: hypothetical protein ABIH23_14550 [bacterium]